MERMRKYLPVQLGNTSEPVNYRAILVQRHASDYNKTKGDLEWYDCPKCLNRGKFAHVRNEEYLYFTDCDCKAQRKSNRLIQESGLKELMREYTFSRYQVHEKWQHILKDNALRYAQTLSGWLVICGQSGSGKTHLCTAVCAEALSRCVQVRYMLWIADTSRLKDPALTQERQQLMEDLKNTPLLYIDDLFKPIYGEDGSSRPSKADIRLAFELINHRYNLRLPTIISTELTPEELWAIDVATASRIREMAGKNIYTIGRDPDRNIRTKL